MAFNIIKLLFLAKIIYIGIFGLLVNCFAEHLPKFLTNTFLYGKTDTSEKNNLLSPKVPKRWFKHFYAFGTIWASIFLVISSTYYFQVINKVPNFIINFISHFSSQDQVATVSAAESIVALLLLTVQIFKRYYETHYVSVFSNSKMHIAHYYLGFFHYFAAVIAIVMESPGFLLSGNNLASTFQTRDLSNKTLIASIIFFLAWWNQLQSACILANLRKNKKGQVITNAHLIPNGGLFEYVSNPHNFCEIVMYICLSIVISGNTTFHYVTAWVLTNQIESALLGHWWYQEKFKNYPKRRKAIIPFIL